jgi:hypothetical protein
MVFVVSAGTKTDTLYTSGGAYLTRLSTPSAGITRANIDTSKTRHATADSATIPIFKGAKTFRDTTTFTGGAYFAGIGRFAGTLIAPVAKIDSLTSRLKVGGDISAYNVADNCYMYSTSTCGTIYTGSSKAGGASFHAGIADAMKILASGNYPLVISHNNNQPIIFGTNDIERGKIYGNGNVEFAGALTTSTLNTDSIKINGGSYLKTYLTGSFPCTLKTSDVTVQQIGTAYWTKIGNVFTCTFPYLSGESNSAFLRVYCSVPYLPRASVIAGCNARNNGTTVAAYGGVASSVVDYVAISLYGSGFTGSGTKTVFSHSVTYVTAN